MPVTALKSGCFANCKQTMRARVARDLSIVRNIKAGGTAVIVYNRPCSQLTAGIFYYFERGPIAGRGAGHIRMLIK